LSFSAFNVRLANAEGLVGDVNDDRIVDLKDVYEVSMALGSYPGHAKWNPQADVNEDDCVNLLDVYIVASHFGETTTLEIVARVRVHPNCLNLRSRGKWVTCSIELPERRNVHRIDISTVVLNLVIPANQERARSENCDDVSRLIVKFDRQAVIDMILRRSGFKERFGTVTLTVTGKLVDGTLFKGSCSIKIIAECS
jgi:hypothetical protein